MNDPITKAIAGLAAEIALEVIHRIRAGQSLDAVRVIDLMGSEVLSDLVKAVQDQKAREAL